MATTETATSPTKRRFDVGLSPWQFDAVKRNDAVRWLFLIGGRGSGKSFIEKYRFLRWAKLSTELHWGIFGSTDTTLNTILAPFTDLLDEMGIEYVTDKEAPLEWRDQWKRDRIKVPPKRRRQHKLLILKTGAHFVIGSLVNGAYTVFKSIEFNGIYFGEGTEPGVTLD